MLNKERFLELLKFAKINNVSVKRDKNNFYYFEYSLSGYKYIFSEGKPLIEEYKPNTRFIQMDFRDFEKHYKYERAKNIILTNSSIILNDLYGMKNNRFYLKGKYYYFQTSTKKICEEGSRESKSLFKFISNEIDPNGLKEIGINEIMDYLQEKYLPIENRYKFHLKDSSKDIELQLYFSKIKEIQEFNNKFIPVVIEAYNEVYQDNLMSESGKAARHYLNNRGIDNDEIKKLGLGLGETEDIRDIYIPAISAKVKDKIKHKLSKDEFSIYEKWTQNFPAYDPAITLGIMNETKIGKMDAMKNRITIPIRDDNNNLVAFGGRKFYEDGYDTPKYLMTKTSPIWKKSDVLFDLNDAKTNCNEDGKPLMIVEGFMDAIALNKIGFAAVALMGVSISDTQIDLLKKHFDRNLWFVSLDFDVAGQTNTEKVFERLNKHKQSTYIFNKPLNLNSKDFDEFINQNNSTLSFDDKKKVIDDQILKDYVQMKFAKEQEEEIEV